ncbi:SnoaL-like domain containing protein [Nitzschia inconspicua]|uniref:SnoaL-like domain containing protein n=1 Tax=Nitzschia inconspicua TaxID=303405 RepID=A0A9K3PF66_9STRA|nr:SnoaL-like domain containing protein [Nitzschia inconspicua]
MPVVSHHRALILPLSPPTSPVGRRQGLENDVPSKLLFESSLMVPYELANGCTEKDCIITSDNAHLTNAIRKHFMLHFGHRDLHALLDEYHPHAVWVHQINDVRTSFHGHDPIRTAWQHFLQQHPTTNSTFELQEIHIFNRTAKVTWSARTPTHTFSANCDVFQFDANGKIAKQVLHCQMERLETPWYVSDE